MYVLRLMAYLLNLVWGFDGFSDAYACWILVALQAMVLFYIIYSGPDVPTQDGFFLPAKLNHYPQHVVACPTHSGVVLSCPRLDRVLLYAKCLSVKQIKGHAMRPWLSRTDSTPASLCTLTPVHPSASSVRNAIVQHAVH